MRDIELQLVANKSNPFSRRRPRRRLSKADSGSRAVFEIGDIDGMDLRVRRSERTHVEGQAMAVRGPTQAHRPIRRIPQYGYFSGSEIEDLEAEAREIEWTDLLIARDIGQLGTVWRDRNRLDTSNSG